MHQGRWSNAVTAILAGSTQATTAAQRRAKRFTDDERIRAWWTCRSTVTNRPSSDDYMQWRRAAAERTGFETWPPSICLIAQRFGDGSWITTCEHLQQQGPPTD
jgi:hypothetical protein